MTQVVITTRIAGHEPGEVVELTDRLQKHVDAGNAVLVPDSGEPSSEPIVDASAGMGEVNTFEAETPAAKPTGIFSRNSRAADPED